MKVSLFEISYKKKMNFFMILFFFLDVPVVHYFLYKKVLVFLFNPKKGQSAHH